MIKVENVKVYNIGRAVYSTRNSYDSWDKSDSDIENDILGPSDLELATKLAKAGSPHNKFMRQIFVTMDVTCSLDFWKQADTYLIGTTKNSCSTMHRIQSKEFSIDDFNTTTRHNTPPPATFAGSTSSSGEKCRASASVGPPRAAPTPSDAPDGSVTNPTGKPSPWSSRARKSRYPRSSAHSRAPMRTTPSST